MLRAHLVADIRAAEEALAATLPDGELMRRASEGLAERIDFIPPGELVVMLIGPGNNGGDALYAAVHLLDRGVRVDLCLLDEHTVHADGLAAALAAGAQIVDEPGGQRWCLDAMFGIGARPGLEGKAAEWARWIDDEGPFVIAVDTPSGIDVDGGTLPESYVDAHLTITFGTFKNGLLVTPATRAAGDTDSLVSDLVDIGLGPHLGAPSLEAIEARDGHRLRDIFEWIAEPASHKYSRGVVGIAAGSEQYAGAAHLCVAGAQAGMAGMVRFAGSEALSARVVDRAPEVVAAPGRVQAWVVGPGGGDDVGALITAALADGVPVVLDAAALEVEHLPESFDVPALLTPHAGELARLLDTDREDVEADPLGHVTKAAERWNATVLLKGPRTLIATPGRPTRVNMSGSTWLATAGAGDVLAGLAGSMVAAGADPHDAGSYAAFLHGAASVGANFGGPVTASDVAAELPRTIAAFHNETLDDDLFDWRD
ncbi:bifunctional ADP-dependent NAD(P)H-hydrate dehydratase/NAD(P)H-hydrate epimerase [Aeromicrobium panaciterrae]|uniref:NAD(P)H-hydrate dehydratase n=1 Tax=Aeromicrobium panaciterrae TaxID=363861 RepID=UPI0031E2432D